MNDLIEGLIGKKIGMTQVYDAKGRQVSVTAILVGPCPVVQKKTVANDGYAAVQIGFGEIKEKTASKSKIGHCKKSGVTPKRFLKEVRLESDNDTIKTGDILTAALFEGVSHVDIIGVTKGRGFQGVMRRHGMHGGRASHGSGFHRRPGSIGQKESPARVWPNKRMAGHMGHERITTQNLEVVQVRPTDNVLLVRGAVPGPIGNIVFVRKAIKKAAKAK